MVSGAVFFVLISAAIFSWIVSNSVKSEGAFVIT